MSQNRCDRCNRELVDPNAQYGWRCENIMGAAAQQSKTLKDDLPDLYWDGMYTANDFLIWRD